MKIKSLFALISFLLTFNLHAKRPLTGFCFESNVSLSRVKSYLSPLLTSKDKVYKRESMNCLEISLSSGRRDLFETFLYRRYKPSRIYQTDGVVEKNQAMGKLPHCRIEIEKIGNSNSTNDELSVGSKNRLKRTQKRGQRTSKSSLLLTSGVKGTLQVNDQSVYVTCHVFGSQYRIELALSSDSSSLSTFVNTSKGNRVNIGEMVDDLNNRSKNLDINKGASFTKEKGKSTSTYYLTIR